MKARFASGLWIESSGEWIRSVPERFEFIEAFPRTSTGKFWKMKVREMFVAS